MAELVADCPRCGAVKMTFDATSSVLTKSEYNWQHWFEVFCKCRNCHRPTIFLIIQREIRWNDKTDVTKHPEMFKGSLNNYFGVERYISLKDRTGISPPEHTPPKIAAVFVEGASSIALGNWNAAGAMFRLAINLATKPLLPTDTVSGLTRRKRRDLGPRIEWLMESGIISRDLFDLSECIREDGNDGAHDGTLTKEDAADLLDFTVALFERMFTEPERLRLAKERRDRRRVSAESA